MDTTTISKYVYTVNPLGQRTSLTTAGTAFTTGFQRNFGYDALGQVTKDDHSTDPLHDRAYQFDTIGNRQKSTEGTLEIDSPTTKNYSVNVLNQYTTINGITRTHDDDGNLTTDGTKDFVWDAENRLIAVQDATTNATLVAYEYDYMSRRITRNAAGNITRYLYNHWNPLAEFKIHNSELIIHNSFTWGTDLSGSEQGAGGVGGLLMVIEHAPTEGSPATAGFFPTFDANGNISEYLNSQGETVAHYEYDAFGNTTVKTGNLANTFTHRFSTKAEDSETGDYYYGYRYYDPITGSWKSKDLIEEEGGLNLYGFVENNPIANKDILGLANVQGGIYIKGWYEGTHDGGLHKLAGGPHKNVVAGHNGASVLQHMQKLSENCNCIEKFIMTSHGGLNNFMVPGELASGLHKYIHTWHPDDSYPNGGYYTDDMAHIPGSRDIRVDLRNSIDREQVRFCKKCEIYAYACLLGYSFLLEMAEVTGCKVIGIDGGKASPMTWNGGGNGAKLDDWFANAPGSWLEVEAGKPKRIIGKITKNQYKKKTGETFLSKGYYIKRPTLK